MTENNKYNEANVGGKYKKRNNMWELVDPNKKEHDFSVAWQHKINKSEWNNFLEHTFNDVNRIYLYGQLRSLLKNYSTPPSFAEIGFGQCVDFVRCFKELHDTKQFIYYGYDVTAQFAEYACDVYPGYNFETKNIFQDDSPNFDITYARHVLEHQAPSQCYNAFEKLLQKTNKTCIVSWFRAPSEEMFLWVPTDGFGQKGAYVNTYDINKVQEIVQKQNFTLQIQEVEEPVSYNTIYFLNKCEI